MDSGRTGKLKLPLYLRLPLETSPADDGTLLMKRDPVDYVGAHGALMLGGTKAADAELKHHAGKGMYYLEILPSGIILDASRQPEAPVRLELVFGFIEILGEPPPAGVHGMTFDVRPLDPSSCSDDYWGAVALAMNGIIVAKGEALQINDRIGIRVTDEVAHDERFVLLQRPAEGVSRGVVILGSKTVALRDYPDLDSGACLWMDSTVGEPLALRFDNGIRYGGDIVFQERWRFRVLQPIEEIERSRMQARMRDAALGSAIGEESPSEDDVVAILVDSPGGGDDAGEHADRAYDDFTDNMSHATGQALGKALDGAMRQDGKEASKDFQRQLEESGIAEEIRNRQVVQPPQAERLYDIEHDLDFDGDPPEHPVQGRILGETFICQKAGVKTNGEVGLLQGDVFTLPMINVNIQLDIPGSPSIENAAFDVAPGGEENYQQHVSISMSLTKNSDPVFETYRDYRLKVVFGQKKNRKIPVSVYLAIPDETRCVLAGSVVADVEEVVYYERGSPPPAFSDDLTPEEVASIAAKLADPVRLGDFLEDDGDPNIRSAVSDKLLLEQIAGMWTEDEGTVSTTFVYDATHYGRNFSAEDCVECARMLLEHGAEITEGVVVEARKKTFLGDKPKTALIDLLLEFGYDDAGADEWDDAEESSDDSDAVTPDYADDGFRNTDLVTMMVEGAYNDFLDEIERDVVPPGPPPKIVKEDMVALGKLMQRLCAAMGETYSTDAELMKESEPDTVRLAVGRMRVARIGEIRDGVGEYPTYLAAQPRPLPGCVFVGIPAVSLRALEDHVSLMEMEH